MQSSTSDLVSGITVCLNAEDTIQRTIESGLSQTYKNIEIIEDGGWHFTQLKTAKDIEIKLVNSEIHGEIKSEGINLQKISGLMKRKTIDYDHKANSTDYKYSKEFKLKALSLEHMPTFLKQNVNKYSEWFDFDK